MTLKTHTTAVALFVAACAFTPLAVQAQTPQAPVAASELSWSDAEVRKIDREAGKITLRHGEIKNLAMPPMTMVFHVKDAALLERASVGSKVRFMAEQEAGRYVVTDLQPATP